MALNILIIAPHPDDEVLGCGGTIVKLVALGYSVSVLYLSSGDKNQKVREKEAVSVCKYFTINKYRFLRIQGDNFKSSMLNIKAVIQVFNETKPSFVYINHDQDSDAEHKISCQIVNEAYWRYNSTVSTANKIKGLIYYEIHKPLQEYNLVEDISKTIADKMKAMAIYKSQLSKTRWDLAIKGLNQYRGVLHEGVSYAEVFKIKKLSGLFSDLKHNLNVVPG